MSVRGLFETHLTVSDLKRSVSFYRDTVGLPVALELPERRRDVDMPGEHRRDRIAELGEARRRRLDP